MVLDASKGAHNIVPPGIVHGGMDTPHRLGCVTGERGGQLGSGPCTGFPHRGGVGRDRYRGPHWDRSLLRL